MASTKATPERAEDHESAQVCTNCGRALYWTRRNTRTEGRWVHWATYGVRCTSSEIQD